MKQAVVKCDVCGGYYVAQMAADGSPVFCCSNTPAAPQKVFVNLCWPISANMVSTCIDGVLTVGIAARSHPYTHIG